MQQLPESTIVITAEVLRAYAELTQDFNPLHLDAQFAAAHPMGGVIAHGTLSINLIFQSVTKAFGAAALERSDLDIRFVKPSRIGEALVSGGNLIASEPLQYAVWVRGSDGEDRLVGAVTFR